MKSQFLLSGGLILIFSLMGCSEENTASTPEIAPQIPNARTSQPLNSSANSNVIPFSKATKPQSAKSESASNPASSNINIAAISENQKISAEGIGRAKVGMTFGQLKKLLGAKAEFIVKSPFMVDLDAIAVSESGSVQFYILYPAWTTLTDSQVIQYLMTDNPVYRTERGVGPGTLLTKAEAVYGDATLFYNTENESREYVKFVNQASANISFRPHAPEEQQFAGIYPSSPNSYHETKEFNKNSSIASVLVSCPVEKCGKR